MTTNNDLATIAHMARALMKQHGLEHVPFKFDKARRRLGATHFSRLTGNVQSISLSSIISRVSDLEDVRQTMLHEIAHALVGHAEGHGPVWVAKARELGYTGGRLGVLPDEAVTAMAWVGTCAAGHVSGRSRRPAQGRLHSCGKCSPKFNSAHLISWMPRREYLLAQGTTSTAPAPAPQEPAKASQARRGSHAECSHPTTPAARAACRKARAAAGA